MMGKRRVVVTGMGIVSPLGHDLASNWDGITHGRSGIGPVEGFDASTYPPASPARSATSTSPSG